MIKTAREVQVGENFRLVRLGLRTQNPWRGPVLHVDASEPGCLDGNVILNYHRGAYECSADTEIEVQETRA